MANRPVSRRSLLLGGTRLAGASLLASGCRRRPAPESGAAAAAPARLYRVGYLAPGSPAAVAVPAVVGQRLRERGYVEGENLELVARAGSISEFSTLARELVQLPVDVLIAANRFVARSAKAVTTTVPIVAFFGSDPVAQGLIASYAHPGGNLTGLHVRLEALARKRLELLHEALPHIAHVAVLWTPAVADAQDEFAALSEAADAFGLRLQPLSMLRTYATLADAFAAADALGVQALVVLYHSWLVERRAELLALPAARRLPTVFSYPDSVAAGGLMSVGENTREAWGRLTDLVARILGGASPAELPVEQSSRFEVTLNLRTARALGLELPPSVLRQADRVVQ